MSTTLALFKRELRAYFLTPVAYVFIVIFLALTGSFTFFMGQFFERGQADLAAFFSWMPWLYLFLMPAIAMRLWAEERKSGTIELLMTLPVSVGQAVVGKFLAAWAFTGIALVLTFPTWLIVNYLGDPDNGVIVASYLASFLMAGAYLSIGSCLSALTKNQVIAFVVSVVVCLFINLAGWPVVLAFVKGWAPVSLVDFVASMSFLTHFDAITRGVVDLRDLVFYVSMMALWLFANAVFVQMRKAA
jgi:ABC-2 type transport system permease protein